MNIIFNFVFAIMAIIFFHTGSINCHEGVNFIQITDPHLFEADNKDVESRNSLIYFYLGVEKANHLNNKLKQEENTELDFILCTGDLGIEKLLDVRIAHQDDKKDIIVKNGKKYKISINTNKWTKALESLAIVLQDSFVKTWLFVPGNNDIYEDNPNTIHFYEKFLVDLQNHPFIQKSQIQIIDFRLESKQSFFHSGQPGIYIKGDLAFVGFDNSYFKNNGVIDSFLDKNGNIKKKEDTIEYKMIKKLSNTTKSLKAKYAYIFMHIPEVDDPWLVTFDKDTADVKNPVYNRLKKARLKSPELAKKLYPYSSWLVPDYIREVWENIVTNKSFGTPEIMGIFTGHLHDKNKQTYMGFHWIKSHLYNTEILSKLYICPTVSIKNQSSYILGDECARGIQYIRINPENGKVKRRIYWLYKNTESE